MRNQVSLRNRQLYRSRMFKFGAIAIIALFAGLFGAATYQGAATHDHTATSMGVLPFVAVGGLMFREADKGGGGGGGSEDAAPALQGNTMEEKLTSAGTIIGDLWTKLTGATSERDTLKTENTRLTEQFNAATSTAGGLTTTLEGVKAELVTAQGTITALTSERDGLKTQLSTSQGNVTRLEKLCGLNGVDPNQALVIVNEQPGAVSTAEDWQVKLAAAKTPEAQHQVLVDFQKAVAEGKVKKPA